MITKNRRSRSEADKRCYFAPCFSILSTTVKLFILQKMMEKMKNSHALFCCRGGWEAQTSPQSPSQRPRLHPKREMAATRWTLARSYSPQLLHTAVISSSEDNLSNYSSENGTVWVIFTSHFSFRRLSLLAVSYLLPLMPALRSSFLGLYFTFNKCFCNFMTIFWS